MSPYYPGTIGCSDANCLFVESRGALTHGGCRCEKDLAMSAEGVNALRAIRYLREQLRQAASKNIRGTLYQ
jgi:hypothetical protein